MMMSDAFGGGAERSRLVVSALIDPWVDGAVAQVRYPPSRRGWTPMGPSLVLRDGLQVALVPSVDHATAAAWWAGVADGATAAGAWHALAIRRAELGIPESGQ